MYMQLNVDIAIISLFLLVNLVTGFYSGRGIKTMETEILELLLLLQLLLQCGLAAVFLRYVYRKLIKRVYGFFLLLLGDVLSLIIIGYVFVPRMKEFFGSLSVAETMGNLYGGNVRLITALSSIAQAIAMTALQIKVFSTVFFHFFGFSSVYATCVKSLVVIFYSAWGGIKAITFTDVIQFLTFGMFIPLFLLFIWHVFGEAEPIIESFEHTTHYLIGSN